MYIFYNSFEFQDPDDDDEDELCTCIVSLMQKGRRAMRDDGMDTLTIGFAIYHLKDPEGAPRYVLIIKQNIYIYLFKKNTILLQAIGYRIYKIQPIVCSL